MRGGRDLVGGGYRPIALQERSMAARVVIGWVRRLNTQPAHRRQRPRIGERLRPAEGTPAPQDGPVTPARPRVPRIGLALSLGQPRRSSRRLARLATDGSREDAWRRSRSRNAGRDVYKRQVHT